MTGWLNPLSGIPFKRRTPDTSRVIVINGRIFPSISLAARRLGVSTTKIYRMLTIQEQRRIQAI